MTFPRFMLVVIVNFTLTFGDLASGQITDPAIIHWQINTTGATGNSPSADIDSVVSGILADVSAVYYNANNTYVQTSGVPSHTTGPFGPNPAFPGDLEAIYRVKRSPQADTSGNNADVGLGVQGVFVNGVSVFNFSDGRSYNNQGIWNQDANVFEASGFDDSPGHPAPLADSDQTTPDGLEEGRYHHHQNPATLREELGDDGSAHSPIIGFANDGFPIYGPFGYTDPNDPASEIARVDSSFVLRDITDRTTLEDGTELAPPLHGPSLAEIALGGYREDYAFDGTAGDLDQHNGRFTITPEFPNGTYAYFVTIDEAGEAAFPYILGDTFYGVPVSQRNVSLPSNVVLYVPPVKLGDFDEDGFVNVTDIDFYSGNIGLTISDAGYDARFDFDNDGTIELEDHNFHINNYVETSNGVTGAILGDMNLDGTVNVLGDAFVLVGQLGSAGPFSYGTGDLNADQVVNVLGDAFILVGRLGQSND